ncbi:MAG: DNA-binding protein [Clostridiales bacterium]|nr:DNA-binding protein [Clostridiales bacterium]
MGFMTASEAAKKWNISQRRVQILCSENRIAGIFKLGDNWAIPENAEKPTDKRLKSNKKGDKNECN